jgi:hypothetical protein
MGDHYTAWAEFHLAHPEVGSKFIEHARQWRERRPEGPCSADLLGHVVRWHTTLGGRPEDGDDFKMNDNYTAYYARWVMRECPELRDPPIFRLRKSDADVYFPELFELERDEVAGTRRAS